MLRLAMAGLVGLGLAACAKAPAAGGGRGQALVEKYGCGACHAIPGIPDAAGMVGPPLDHMASRQYVAGMLRNTPDNMAAWLRHPQSIVPGNAMPDLGLSEADAQAIATYLATLK